MNCKDFKELLSAYADGELSLIQRDFIEEHLADCPDCMVTVNSYKSVNLKIKSLRDTQVMPDIKGTTMSNIKREQFIKPTRKWLRPAPVVICAIITLLFVTVSVWAVTQKDPAYVTEAVNVDMFIYSSIEELCASSNLDAVVIGTVKGIADHDVSNGIPVVFYEFEVTEVLHGVADGTIIVSMIDTSTEIKTSLDDSVTPFIAGEQLLLFLGERDSSGLSCGSPFYHFYTPISYDNGVFDILDGDIVSPRMQWAFKPIGGTDELITFSLSEIREKVHGWFVY
jgi:hypothetical protein